MAADLLVTCTPELAELRGTSEQGTDFVEAWKEYKVGIVDNGELVIPLRNLHHLIRITAERGLTLQMVSALK